MSNLTFGFFMESLLSNKGIFESSTSVFILIFFPANRHGHSITFNDFLISLPPNLKIL